MGMQIFAQLSKVDEAKRLVYGIAAQEMPDHSGEILDYASSKPYFAKWSEGVSKDTEGKSLGNLRAMHGKVAAGKLTAINFNDADKSVEVCAKVVDDNEWNKVLEGVYTGFSIGGDYVGAKTVEKVDGKDVSRYTAKPNELSLVDRPCIPTAKFFEVQKADGSLAKVAFQEPVVDPDEVQVDGTPEQVAALGKTLNENGLNLGDALAIIAKGAPAFLADKKGEKPDDKAKPPADGEKPTPGADGKKPVAEPKGAEGKDALPAKGKGASDAGETDADAKAVEDKDKKEKADKAVATGALRKGVYDCDGFSGVLTRLLSLQSNAAYEAMRSGDKAMTAKLGAIIAMVGEAFKELIDSVVATSDSTKNSGMLLLSEQAGELSKAVASDFVTEDADPMVALLKIGARNNAGDRERLGKIHAIIAELGHECVAAAKADDAGSLAKLDEAVLQKMVATAVEPLQKQLQEQGAELTKLRDQPAVTRVALRTVSKTDDVLQSDAEPLTKVDPTIVDARGEKHEAAGLIKSLHQTGGVPMAMPAAFRK